ncbi:MAG TPA: ABC transporter substrate-binding protein [Gammaproteobacteria bacterium]|nr:ABC transporter substrate-binding protein [Gammaproteobacteria bacterium]HRA42361.1 ABC transporter substrate-binding protein [Gammaproteobacteria bacterium]
MLVSFSFSSIPSRILNFLFCLSAFLGCCEPIQAAELSASLKPLQIGILIPMEHAALRDIVAGFETIVRAHYPNRSIYFNVQSAQGDIKLQRSIIELFVGQQVDMIVPVGTSATQMTLALVKELPIVSLAAQYTEVDRQKRAFKNMTGVLDEISGKKKLAFIKAIMPNIKTITLIYHSGNEKNYAEIAELKTESKVLGITLQTLMIQVLPELETAARTILPDTEIILIGKDHLLASGIRMLVPIAAKRGIPLMTSDEGTVAEGAAVALGVSERMIGEEGGKLATRVLDGYPIKDLPMQEMQALAVFYNPAAQQQKITVDALQDYARKNHVVLMKCEKLMK